MYCVRPITADLFWVGASDRRLAQFENAYPIPRGISYNAYVVLDEKTVLLDTVDQTVGDRFFENLEHVLDGRVLDYVVINHMEPDHCAALGELLRRYPAVQIVGNAKTLTMIGQFFDLDVAERFVTVKEGDTLSTGRHSFRFLMAPMVHWPETMITYDETEKTLFSADAFGTFGAQSGGLFADEVDFQRDWMDEARRYYANIVGKYGPQVQMLLGKAAKLEIRTLCPLHGPVWRREIGLLLEKYRLWSTWTPEERGVLIVYGSVYGHTQNAAEILASRLAEKGVTNLAMYDVSVTHPSYLVSDAFRFSHLVAASATYNMGIFPPMETFLLDLKAHALQNRTAAVIENGTWAPQSGRLIRELLESMKNITVLGDTVSLHSSVKDPQRQALCDLADALAADVQQQ
ncbi:MAG: FprA family A-type flavoprotein [Oscillibacter sp.]|jgi:flavorubredoxin|nr:FprA family A-type flavoprotein [Oscillibacter sp.]